MVQERQRFTSLTISLRLVSLTYFQSMVEIQAILAKYQATRNQPHATNPDRIGFFLIALTRFLEGEMRDGTRLQGRRPAPAPRQND